MKLSVILMVVLKMMLQFYSGEEAILRKIQFIFQSYYFFLVIHKYPKYLVDMFLGILRNKGTLKSVDGCGRPTRFILMERMDYAECSSHLCLIAV